MKALNLQLLLLSGVICGVLSQGVFAQALIFKNQRGSIMTLNLEPQEGNTGSITGSFTTAVGNCKADMRKPMPLKGFYNGNAISVSINFPHCQQVVAMTGHLLDSNQALTTLWQDATQANDPQNIDWRSNVFGADQYARIG